MHITAIHENEVMNLKENMQRYMGDLGGERERQII